MDDAYSLSLRKNIQKSKKRELAIDKGTVKLSNLRTLSIKNDDEN